MDVGDGSAVNRNIITSLRGLTWPENLNNSEKSFNREHLLGYLRTVLNEVNAKDQKDLRKSNVCPLFGWGRNKKSGGINGKIKTDGTFVFKGHKFFVETKIVQTGRECDIKNSLVQVVEYLNMYNVDLGILLMFDMGRGTSKEWENGAEKKLLDLMVSNYSMCVVRVRESCQTKVYAHKNAENTHYIDCCYFLWNKIRECKRVQKTMQ